MPSDWERPSSRARSARSGPGRPNPRQRSGNGNGDGQWDWGPPQRQRSAPGREGGPYAGEYARQQRRNGGPGRRELADRRSDLSQQNGHRGDRNPQRRAREDEPRELGRSRARHAPAGGAGRGGEPPGQRAGRRPRRSWPQRIVLGTGVLLVLALLTGASGALWVMDKISNVDRVDVNVDHAAAGEPANYLLVGSDIRPESGEFGDVGGQRSDTIMILRVDPENEQASLLSLPRDLMVPIAGDESGELQKLNSAYTIGNQTLIDTIRLNFGIEVNHYVIVDFEGFRRLVDAVGGVGIYIDRAIKDDQSGLFIEQLGCVTLNGDQALDYVRSRHLQYMTEGGEWSREDPLADLGRIQRQQVFIRAALTKALAQAAGLNPAQITELVTIGTDSVSLDPDSDPFELADQFSSFSLDDLQTHSLPVIDLVPEVSVQMDPINAPSVLAIFRGADPSDVAAESITVDVLNGTGVESQANDVGAALQAVGFRLGERADYEPQPVANTIVFHRPGEEVVGLRVARHITGGAQIQVRDDLESGRVVVVTGQDFTTVHMQPTPVDQMPTPAGGAPAGGGETTTTAPTQTTAPAQTTTTTPRSEYTVGQPC